MESDTLTIAEVAAETRHRRSAIERWIHVGIVVNGERVRLAAKRLGGRWFVPREALTAFVDALNPGPPAAVETVAAMTRRGERDQEEARRLMARGAR